MDLSTAELRALLDITGRLHEPASGSLVERPELIQKLGSLLHVDLMAQLFWWPGGAHHPHSSALWGRDQGMRAEYRHYFHALDPIAELLQDSFEPVVIERKISRAEWSRSEYFTDYLCRHQAYPGVSLRLPYANGMLLDYRFSTSDPKKRFGEREILLLNRMRSITGVYRAAL